MRLLHVKDNKAYWIWNFGDFELYHAMRVHSRREEYSLWTPPIFKVSRPSFSAIFIKNFKSEMGGSMTAYMCGVGRVKLDGTYYGPEVEISFDAGEHTLEVTVMNESAFPALLITGDVCTDPTWESCPLNWVFAPVGFDEAFVRSDTPPTVFPFEYEKKFPISETAVQNGTLYDFGEELFASLEITGAPATDVTVSYGESAEEACEVSEAVIRETLRGQSEYKLLTRAFRYVYIEDGGDTLSLVAEHEYLPLERRGTFSCSNELYNKIYDAAEKTFHLNCREAFLDGIKRDRWIWSGDAYQSARINGYLYADDAIVRRTATALVGAPPFDSHINKIVDYSLYFIIGLYEYYMTYGDAEYVRRMYPQAVEIIRFCEGRLNADGFLIGVGHDWVFIDWADMDKDGALCAEQLLFSEAYRVMSCMARVAGADGEDEFAAKHRELAEKIDRFFWREELGAYIDTYESGRDNVTRHANIFAVMYDHVSPLRGEKIARCVFDNDAIPKITTPYFKGYELDVYGKLGRLDRIEHELDSYWGGMIELGASTVWEEFDPTQSGIEHYSMYGGKYQKSLCHAWGAGPIYLFGRYYLGVYPTSPGYETFAVEPKLGGLDKISGSVYAGGANVRLSYDSECLTVSAERGGGVLIFNGERREIKPGVEMKIQLK